MPSCKVLIVEDEAIVAEDLKGMLKKLGYEVVGIADNGQDALALAANQHPDLVLMDIHIQGPMDGIDTAEQIAVHHDIPVTYLTAYADEKTLERAKATLPYGYILKPFEERDLRTSIEVALYKHRMQHVLEKMDGWYADTLQSIGYGIVTVDTSGHILYMNKTAEMLTGRSLLQLLGSPVNSVLAPVASDAGEADIQSSTAKPMRIRYTRSPLTDREKKACGHVISFQPLSSVL